MADFAAQQVRKVVMGHPTTVISQAPQIGIVQQPSPFALDSRFKERFWVDDWLYDSETIVSKNNTTLFQTPKGQSSKTATHTNITQAGLLPSSKRFIVEGYSIHFHPFALYDTDDSYVNILKTLVDGYWQVKVRGGTIIQEGPLNIISSMKIKDRFFRISGDTSYRHFYFLESPYCNAKGYFPLSKEGRYELAANDEFNVYVQFENTISASNPWRMYFVFWGKSDRRF